MIKIDQKKKWPWQERTFKIIDYNVNDLVDKIQYIDHDNSNILQIDGGGIRGVIPLVYLYTLEEKMKTPLSDIFSTFWGTSTGSIIAAGLACNVSARELLQLYVEDGPNIFHDRPGGLYNIFHKNSYKTDYIDKLLLEYFGDDTFEALWKVESIELNVSVVDIVNRCTVICNHISTPNMHIREAVRASISAPVYFGPYKYVDSDGNQNVYYDGGTGVFGSTLRKAVNREKYIKNKNWSDFYVLSLGTGFVRYDKNVEEIMNWNKIKQFLWTFEYGREESVVDQVHWCEHRKSDVNLQYDRFNTFITKNIERMDETDNIKMLVDAAQNAILYPNLRVR